MSTNLNVRDLSENSNDDNTSIATIENKKKKELIDKICMAAAEVIGTGLLTFFGCMGCIDWIQMPGKKQIKYFMCTHCLIYKRNLQVFRLWHLSILA